MGGWGRPQELTPWTVPPDQELEYVSCLWTPHIKVSCCEEAHLAIQSEHLEATLPHGSFYVSRCEPEKLVEKPPENPTGSPLEERCVPFLPSFSVPNPKKT